MSRFRQEFDSFMGLLIMPTLFEIRVISSTWIARLAKRVPSPILLIVIEASNGIHFRYCPLFDAWASIRGVFNYRTNLAYKRWLTSLQGHLFHNDN